MVKKSAEAGVVKRIEAEEVVVKGGASQGDIGGEEERSGGGSLRETGSKEVSFKSGCVIIVKLGRGVQGGEHH